MENEILRKLTDEEKQKIIFVVNDLISEELPEEPTEFDVLMKQKTDEFRSYVLNDDESSRLLELCEKYINGDKIYGFGLVIMFDMWLNKSNVWPVMDNPEWDEWNKLKDKKVKKD